MIILLAGLALSAMVFGGISYVRGLQGNAFTLHATTQAQLQAWSAAEAMRQYLAKSGAGLADLAAGQVITFKGALAEATGTITAVETTDASHCGGGARVQLALAGTGGPAKAGLDVVYCVTAGPAVPEAPPFSDNSIRGPLSISGGNVFKGSGDSRLVVEGDVNGSGSITGYDAIHVTGNVKLSGYSQIGVLSAEGSIDVEGSFTKIESMADVTLRGGSTTASLIRAGGTVADTNGGTYDTIEAFGNIQLTDGTKAKKVRSRADVSGRSSIVSSELLAQGSFVETGCCSKVTDGSVGKKVTLVGSRDPSAVVNLSVKEGLTVDLAPVTRQDVQRPKVDANKYRAAANYVFDVDAKGNKIVTVHAVEGLPDGKTYYIAGSGGHQDYLCETTSYDAASCTKKICTGYSDYNSCFGYWGGNWSLNGPSAKTILPPGIAYFVGSVTVGSGHYYNTLLASRDISTASDTYVIAPNYASADQICSNSQFPEVVPSNLCEGGKYKTLSIADVALLAGSYDAEGVFSGGLISLGSKNEITGTVVAGDRLETAGNTSIAGFVTTAYQGSSGKSNSFGAKTVIDQTTVHRSSPATSGGNGSAKAAGASILWSRYR
ncbi:MAG TPA: hypothetical protein VK195_14325 [Burkholderiaceae bacterium]|nr:hypothetical protein [Burkholderiaceae bacterium]